MKKNIIKTTLVLGMALTSIIMTACNKPTERPSVVNKEAAPNLFAIKDLSEITNKSALYSGNKTTEAEIKKMDASLRLMKIEGRNKDLLNLIKNEDTKKALETHLETGAIAVVVLNNEIKILKIVKETHSNLDGLNLTSLRYLSKLKQLIKTTDKVLQSGLVSEIESIKHIAPADLEEVFGLSQIASIKVAKHGVLDNEKTDYNEKKSIINLLEAPFELSTHILVGGEAEGASAETK